MYKVHKYFLSRYSNLFDDAIFIIVLDDINDEESVDFVKNFVINCGFNKNNTIFHVAKNTELRDSRTFYDYIVTDFGSYEGITFFAHTKGLTNIVGEEERDKNIVYWTSAMYFFNLENMSDFENSEFITYFNPFVDNSNFIEKYSDLYPNEPKYKYYPVGTFLLFKDKAVSEYMRDNDIGMPKMEDRFYGEKFFGNIIPFCNLTGIYGPYIGLEMLNFYLSGKQNIEMLYDETEKWEEFKNIVERF